MWVVQESAAGAALLGAGWPCSVAAAQLQAHSNAEPQPSTAETGAALRQASRRQFAAGLGNYHISVEQTLLGVRINGGSVHVSGQLHLSLSPSST